MKLDVNVLRYLSKEDFRVLTAVEMGQKNHELVPMQLIDSISGLKHGGAYRCLKTLLQHKLVHHEGHKYDGYRLTYMGYDFLAIRALVARGHIAGVGRQIGVGKESDIFEVSNDEGEVFALKLHRLGRTSFRDVKSKRDYLGTRSSYSWLYLSRLAALKEFAFMKALGDHGFPVPVAIDNNRHAVLMELVAGQPLVQVRELAHPADVYSSAMGLIARLAACGLIHCDFNEFNLLVADDESLTLIDFPQMVSVSHANARELFERDVECIIRFFSKKIGYVPQLDPDLASVRPSFDEALAAAAAAGGSGLDVELAASGFSRQHQATLERALGGADGSDNDDDDDDGGEGSGSGAPGSDAEDASSSGSSSSGSGEEEGSSGSEEAAEAQAAAAAGASSSGQRVAAGGDAEVAALAERLAAAGGASSSRAAPAPPPRHGHGGHGASASTARWLEQHARGVAGAESGSGSEEPEAGGEAGDAGAAAAAAAVAGQQQQQWDEASVAPSRAPTDVSFMGREVQARLVAQRQKAAARAAASRITRNVSKARGKKQKAAAAAMAEW